MDHDRLRELCQGLTLRLLPADTLMRLTDEQFGAVKRGLIARDPDDKWFLGLDHLRESGCVVCGQSFHTPTRADTVRAWLELQFERLPLPIGRSVWVHVDCFSFCAETGEQRGFPY